MNSKEIVEKTLSYSKPERIANSFPDTSDIVMCSHKVPNKSTDWQLVSENKWERFDAWGNTWSRIDSTSKGEVTNPILSTAQDAVSYQLPDYSNISDYSNVKKKCQKNNDKYIIGMLPGFAFGIARKLFRLDNYLMNIILERDKIVELHDKIDTALEQMIINYSACGVDAVMLHEDWGTQSQTLLSPELWQEEFFPRFEKLCRLSHDKNLKVFMHSCGKIEKIMPGLIKAGIDVFQFDQPDLHTIDKLAEYQNENRVSFWSPVDIQTTLQTKDENLIRIKAKEMIDKLWRGQGGFIAGYYTDNHSIGLDEKWQKIACDEFLLLGQR
ncbi:MAG: uroporphyrinogen decarboxylase family protein [Sedimentisphaeraceae bacterium JB056]